MFFEKPSARTYMLAQAVVRAWRKREQDIDPAIARYARALCNPELPLDDRVSLECITSPSKHRQLKAEARLTARVSKDASWDRILSHYILNNAALFRKNDVELAATVYEAAP